MNRLKQLKTYPFGLFLWLEWILLSTALLVDLPSNYLWAKYRHPDTLVWLGLTLSLLCILVLGVMGLKLPQKKRYKWFYFYVQITLIWLPTIYNNQAGLSLFSCLIIVMRNGLIFQPKECRVANIILFLSIVPSTAFYTNYEEFQAIIARYQTVTYQDFQWGIGKQIVSTLVLVALCIILFWVLVNVLLKEHQSQQQLALAREQLRQYAIQAEDRATVYERNRIAREIHDSVGHVLTAQTIQLNNAIAFWQVDSQKSYQFITESQELVATALKEIRHSINTLRADPIKGRSLTTALKLLLQEFSSRTRIIPQSTMALNHNLTAEIKLTIYRITQEALTNIAKHSQATVVRFVLKTFPEYLYLSIADNGKGFNPQQNTTGFGIQGMKERITAVNGNITISSSINSGCIIDINIPLSSSI